VGSALRQAVAGRPAGATRRQCAAARPGNPTGRFMFSWT